MKKALTIFALLISGVAMGQETKTLAFISVYVTPDTTGKICKERGHISPGVGMSTLVWCPPYQIDYPDSTVMVYPACNTHSFVCSRCGEMVSEPEKESRVITWRRPIQIMDTTFILTDSIRGISHLFSDESKWITGTEATVYKEPSINFYNPSGKIIQSITWRDKVLTFQMLLDYEKQCLKDTLKTEKIEDDYVVWHYRQTLTGLTESYGEALTEKQLTDMGYKYIYRYYRGFEPVTRRPLFDYYFVKEATLKGFIQWYKEKVK